MGYTSWCAVAGFFDGDGCVSATARKDTIRIQLEFSDNWLPQITQIKRFLASRGIRTGKISRSVSNAYLLYVSYREGILRTAKAMLAQHGCLFKKKAELQWVIDYFEDRLTGTEFMEKLNSSVESHNRMGKIRHVNIPHLHTSGNRQRYLRSAAVRRVLSDEQKRQIVFDRDAYKMTYAELALRFQVSITTIARVLGKRTR